jgi:transposase-like protein
MKALADLNIPKTLLECSRYFSDPEISVEFLAALRWKDGVVCPHCAGKQHSYLKTRRIWKCRGCEKQFSVKVGTVFEDSPVPLDKWMMVVWLVVNCKNGVSSWEIHRGLKVTQKTAWFMLHRVRLALRDGSLEKAGTTGSGEVEVDESYIGGSTRNMHKSRKEALQRAVDNNTPRWKNTQPYPGKTAVQGILDRDLRRVRAKVVPNIKRETLQMEILNGVEFGAKLYSDDAVAYNELASLYAHEVVNHTEQYVRGRVHTNGLENFWSLLKRGLRGTYVAVEPFHLERYVDEQVFRYNNCATKDNPLNDSDRFVLALSQIAGKRLTYKQLTGKEEGATTPF